MTDALGILSIGPPPERHADRVVAAMLRQLAQTRAHLFPAICAALQSSSDGTPQAQRKLERRIKEAGALSTLLTPGKRGRYTLHFCDCTGWDPARNVEITLADLDTLPPQSWLAYRANRIKSAAGGRQEFTLTGEPFLFVTHHCLSRAAQRADARTVEHLLIAAECIMKTVMTFSNKTGWPTALTAPREGWRVPLADNPDFAVVLRRHERRKALVAATLLRNCGGAPR